MNSKRIIGFILLSLANFAYAGDNVAKEDITPPPAEGALTPSQIPPITSFGKAVTPAKPTIAAPTTPSTTTSTPPVDNSGLMNAPASAPSTSTAPPSSIIMGQ